MSRTCEHCGKPIVKGEPGHWCNFGFKPPKRLKVFEALVELRNTKRSPEGWATGRSLTVVYKAPDEIGNHREAILAAKRFGEGRVRAFPEDFEALTCIKVYIHEPQEIGPDGEYRGTGGPLGGMIFEWKCDWPGTFKEHLAAACRKPK